MREISIRERLPRDALWIVAVVMLSDALLTAMVDGIGYDSHAYWLAGRELTYGGSPGERDAYLYSPLFAQLIAPLAALPFPVFGLAITAAAAVTFAWLLKPLPARWAIPCWLLCVDEMLRGNVHWIFAVVVVVGLNRPVLWVLPALTKITPCLGPVWYLARGEWRRLFGSIGWVVVLLAVSAAADPGAWVAWFSFLVDHLDAAGSVGAGPPLPLRLPVAIALTLYAARTNRVWLLPVAMVLATPVLGPPALTILAAIPRLLQRSSRDSLGSVAPRPALSESPAGDLPRD